MSTTLWRYVLCACALFALFIAAGDAFDADRYGNIGILYNPISEEAAIVTAVSPDSPAFVKGVKVGDRIVADWIRIKPLLGQFTAGGRFRAGQQFSFFDARLHRTITVTAMRIPTIYAPSRIISHLMRLLALLIALGLFWKLPQDRAARALGGFFVVYELQGWGNTGSFAFGTVFATYLEIVARLTVWLMLVLFACWFPNRDAVDLRRQIAASATAFIALMDIFGVLAATYALFGVGPHLPDQLFLTITTYVVPAFLGLLIVAALIIDFRTATQLDRLRLEWVTAGMAIVLYTDFALSAIPSVFTTFSGSFNLAGLIVSDIAQIAGSFCIVYGFLRYRVLDITFAINRAAVFAILSSIVVAIFVLVEYVVGKYVESQSHVTSALITVVVALIIGISLRTLHGYVDRVADRVIFRSRHDGVEALRKFGRRASFVADEEKLLQQTLNALTAYAGAQHATIYFADGDDGFNGTGEYVSSNDPIVLALKDTRAPVFVDGSSSTVRAELVFPMLVRGELIGFAACARRRMRETYTPDEVQAMDYALEHVAMQLDAIRTARLQSQIVEVQELVRAYQTLGADPARVLARIGDVSGAQTATPRNRL